jgi:alanine racemase
MIERRQKPRSNPELETGNRELAAERPTWAEVDLKAIADNYRALTSMLAPEDAAKPRFRTGNPRIIPVIKANAYGHGMIPVARALAAAGATMFAVFFVEEALQLREAGISQDILVMGTSWMGQEITAIENRLILTVDTLECVRSLEVAAGSLDVTIPVHIKVDTGMGRLGVRWNSMESLLNALTNAKGVCVKGIFSHLSSAEESDRAFTQKQISRFEHSLSAIHESGLECGEIHFANSAGLLYFDSLQHWSARAGIAIYGYHPDPNRTPIKLRPALCLKSRVGAIKWIEAGEPVGYNRRYHASRKMRLTTLCLGYADGFNRGLGNRDSVIIRDRPAPVIGTVSMDMIAVDLSDLPEVSEGDEAIVLGSSAHCRVTAQDLADTLETIPYEVLCAIAPRIPRIYV